jgi:CheY-like chemotaxis protein
VTANALKGEEQRCLAVGMDAYITKPISMEKLRLTLQRWLPIREPSAEAAQPPRPGNEVLAIDASILGAWLGDDAAAVAALLGKFASTAVEAQSEIASAMRQGKLAVVAAAAHKLNGAARAVGAIGVAEVAARLEQAAKAGDRATCSAALRPLAREIRRVLAAVEQA